MEVVAQALGRAAPDKHGAGTFSLSSYMDREPEATDDPATGSAATTVYSPVASAFIPPLESVPLQTWNGVRGAAIDAPILRPWQTHKAA